MADGYHHSQSSPSSQNSWTQHTHPNGDIYYYNQALRLIATDDVRDPVTLGYILDARNDQLECLQDDPNYSQLPSDVELVITDVTPETAILHLHSRVAGKSWIWTPENGLDLQHKHVFWAHVAEFPCHHPQLPPNTEAEFVQAIRNARIAVSQGVMFPFTARQLDLIYSRYQSLKQYQAQGANVLPGLAWLMGAVMPLDAIQRPIDADELGSIMSQLHF